MHVVDLPGKFCARRAKWKRVRCFSCVAAGFLGESAHLACLQIGSTRRSLSTCYVPSCSRAALQYSGRIGKEAEITAANAFCLTFSAFPPPYLVFPTPLFRFDALFLRAPLDRVCILVTFVRVNAFGEGVCHCAATTGEPCFHLHS
jgi:hypothetical protein